MAPTFTTCIGISLLATCIGMGSVNGETDNTKPPTSAAPTGAAVKDGVIYCFPDGAKDGLIAHCQIEDKKLWVDAVKRGGKIRQIRVTSYVGGRGTKTPVKLFCPEITDGTFTWNMPVTREGDVVSLMLPWNGVLIGDLMDVNEGGDAAAALRKKLGVDSGADGTLPLFYSSGDSISLCYWPYLEAELNGVVNVYYQEEAAKDISALNLVNNGIANFAYGYLETAYKDPRFAPKYLLMNFGLHMTGSHKDKVVEYGQWIEKMDDLAKQHSAQLIWLTTTPYDQAYRPELNLVILEFNETAKAVAAKRSIPVVDLHACTLKAVEELGAKKVYEDGVHFTDEVRMRQAAFIATRVREILKTEKTNK